MRNRLLQFALFFLSFVVVSCKKSDNTSQTPPPTNIPAYNTFKLGSTSYTPTTSIAPGKYGINSSMSIQFVFRRSIKQDWFDIIPYWGGSTLDTIGVPIIIQINYGSQTPAFYVTDSSSLNTRLYVDGASGSLVIKCPPVWLKRGFDSVLFSAQLPVN